MDIPEDKGMKFGGLRSSRIIATSGAQVTPTRLIRLPSWPLDQKSIILRHPSECLIIKSLMDYELSQPHMMYGTEYLKLYSVGLVKTDHPVLKLESHKKLLRQLYVGSISNTKQLMPGPHLGCLIP